MVAIGSCLKLQLRFTATLASVADLDKVLLSTRSRIQDADAAESAVLNHEVVKDNLWASAIKLHVARVTNSIVTPACRAKFKPPLGRRPSTAKDCVALMERTPPRSSRTTSTSALWNEGRSPSRASGASAFDVSTVPCCQVHSIRAGPAATYLSPSKRKTIEWSWLYTTGGRSKSRTGCRVMGSNTVSSTQPLSPVKSMFPA